jgi:TetR/AcrR family hemagglutinin/protease transcriptional regulator
MRNRNRLSPEARRHQLVETAIETFADMGIERTGHGDIAKRAGVSTATVFNYFPTREVLTQDVLNEIEAQIIEMFETLPEAGNDARTQILSMAGAYEKMIEDRPATLKAYLSWSVSFNPDLRPQYLATQNHIFELIKMTLPAPLNNDTDALIVHNAANMMAIMKFDDIPRNVMLGFIQRLIDALLASPK